MPDSEEYKFKRDILSALKRMDELKGLGDKLDLIAERLDSLVNSIVQWSGKN